MNNKLTLSAFSLIEAIVGMAITAIIMGIIFVIFSIVTERMLDYKNQNQLVNDMNRLTYSINKDIFENEQLQATANEMIFTGYAGEIVKYSFQEKYILRHAPTFVDTFMIRFNYVVIDSLSNKSKRSVFRQLKLHLEVNQNATELTFYKKIYANELLQAVKE